MLGFLNAYGLLIGIIAGILGIIAFVESRRHPVFRQPGTVSGVVFASLCLIALTAGLMTKLSSSEGYTAGTSANTSRGTNLSSTSTPTLIPSPTPTPSPTPSPFPTPSPMPKTGLLYQVDSTWNGWGGTSDWKIANGMLLNDGTNASYHTQPTISAPYQPGEIADYAVEARIQVESALTTNTVYPCFDITVRGVSSAYAWQGYDAGVCISPQANAGIGMRDSDTEAGLASIPYNPGNTWHTYRAEVKGTTIKLLIDGGLMVTANDNRFLSGGQIGLLCYNTQIDISSFKVIAL